MVAKRQLVRTQAVEGKKAYGARSGLMPIRVDDSGLARGLHSKRDAEGFCCTVPGSDPLTMKSGQSRSSRPKVWSVFLLNRLSVPGNRDRASREKQPCPL